MLQNKGNLSITALPVGPIQTNCYIVANEETKKALVFDPGEEAERIYDYIKKKQLTVEAILFTHGHFDHIGGGTKLAALCGVRSYISEGDKDLCEDLSMNGSDDFGFQIAMKADLTVNNQQILPFLDTKVQVIATPGHTRGSVCYYFEKEGILISGDTLFLESCGRTDLPTGSTLMMIQSINHLLDMLSDSVSVYPGHGPMTTIGYEKRNNPYRNGV